MRLKVFLSGEVILVNYQELDGLEKDWKRMREELQTSTKKNIPVTEAISQVKYASFYDKEIRISEPCKRRVLRQILMKKTTTERRHKKEEHEVKDTAAVSMEKGKERLAVHY